MKAPRHNCQEHRQRSNRLFYLAIILHLYIFRVRPVFKVLSLVKKRLQVLQMDYKG